MVCLLGEILVKGQPIDYESIARGVCKEVGYDNDEKGLDGKTMRVITNIER